MSDKKRAAGPIPSGTYKAELRGAAVPGLAWEGRVRSVFSRAVNISTRSGELVSLVTEELQMTEFSLLLSSLPPLKVGLEVQGDNRQLKIFPAGASTVPGEHKPQLSPPQAGGEAGGEGVTGGGSASASSSASFPPPASSSIGPTSQGRGEPVVINLQNVPLWHGAIHGFQKWCFDPRLPGALRHALKASSKPDGLLGLAAGDDNPWVRKARSVLQRATAAESAALDLSGLIGLGVGFTPSGDDFIAGACAAEELLISSGFAGESAGVSAGTPPAETTYGPLQLPRIDRRCIKAKAEKTTYGSRALLLSAAAGAYSALVLELLRGIAAPFTSDIPAAEAAFRRTVNLAETYGETSGIDTLVGMWWYLSLLVPDEHHQP